MRSTTGEVHLESLVGHFPATKLTAIMWPMVFTQWWMGPTKKFGL